MLSPASTFDVATETPAGRQSVSDGLPGLLPRLWRFGLTLTADRDAAEDLVQAACLRALERQDQFRPGTRLDSWLYAIMSSIWKNRLRGLAVRRGAGVVDAEEAFLADTGASQDLSLLARQVLERVAALPEAQRSVVLLVCVEGFSYAEAAEALGVPVGTVMSRLSTARKALAPLGVD